MPFVDFRKTAEDDIVGAFYKENEVKLIYHGNKKIFESKRLYTTFIAEKNPNNSDYQYLYIDNLSTLGEITELYINGVLRDVPIQIQIQTPVNVKIKGQFTVQGSDCDMHDFFIADGLESVVNVGNTMFKNCVGIRDLDLTYFNTSAITNMPNLFMGCTRLETANINSFDMINVRAINSMFNGCEKLTRLDISGWKNPNKITTAASMFRWCGELEEVYLPQFTALTNVQSMFQGCEKLTKLDISSWDTSNITSYANMLSGVNEQCEIYVSSNFPFSESQLGWGGTFKTK